jgi:hypothetical protein
MKQTVHNLPYSLREWGIIGLFTLLTVILLYPLSLQLTSTVPEPTDPLLNVWRMQWNAHAFLNGPDDLVNIFNTNIFFPFPLTLVYSEHFLMIAAQALPFLLIADGHLLGMNLAVLVTFVLSGYAMYLLITDWTGLRWAGLVAGLLFAFSPQRFGQLNHLELLVTQWMPLALLALHWTLTRPGVRYPLLFMIFFNLQALSGFHYWFNLTIACGLLTLVYIFSGRIRWRMGLWFAGAASVIVTLLLNWPVWRMYLRFSDVMGAIRTPGEVRIYSAALTDYFTSLPHNLIYGKILGTFGRWQLPNHQIQPLLPVGVVGLLLAIVGLSVIFIKTRPQANGRPLNITRYALPTILFFLLLTFFGLLLSFGLNDEALGPALVPLLKFSPYQWLYENIFVFQAIRVPGRFSVLVLLGLAGLAGWGTARLLTTRLVSSTRLAQSLVVILIIGIAIEYWSVPLIGQEIPAGQQIAPVYHWLQSETPPETVVLELPYGGASEFFYEYTSSYHWRRLANGGTGYTPPIYKELRQWFNAFPDPRSVDVLQQLGIDLVVLHPAAYSPEAWQQLQAELPLYLPAIERLHQVGDDLVLHIAPSECEPDADQVTVTLSEATLDGLPYGVRVTTHNTGPAAFVSDVRNPSRLTFNNGGPDKNFTEPLVVPANETESVVVPLNSQQQLDTLSGAWPATLNREISAESTGAENISLPPQDDQWQPLGLRFADGPELLAYQLTPEQPTNCGSLTIHLMWRGGHPGDTATVRLSDPFGRLVSEQQAQPWADGQPETVDSRTISLVSSLPPGRYGLRIAVNDANGAEKPPITGDGVTIPTDQIPPLPVIIHPHPRLIPTTDSTTTPPPLFADTIQLVGSHLAQEQVTAGDWLRFSLVWQTDQPLETELTVFTQLLGPDGQVWGQHDNQPGGGWYSTSLWPAGQPVTDDYAFQIAPDAPPGTYRLIGGLYHSETGERLTTPTGTDFVEIGQVAVE